MLLGRFSKQGSKEAKGRRTNPSTRRCLSADIARFRKDALLLDLKPAALEIAIVDFGKVVISEIEVP